MYAKLKIIIICIVSTLILSASLTAQESMDKLANEFGQKFISMLNTKDTNQLIQLLPTSKEIEWLVENKLSEERKAYYLKNYTKGQDLVDLLKGNLFFDFANNNEYMEFIWPIVSLNKIKFEKAVIRPVSEDYESSYTTHFIDIIFSQTFQDFGKIKYNLEVNVALVHDKFALVFYDVETNFYELTSPQSEETGAAIVKALFSHDTLSIKEYLHPSQDDIEWEVKQRFTIADFDECTDYPEDCFLTKESYDKLINISIPKYFSDLQIYFSSVVEKEPIKDYKITGYKDIPYESFIGATNYIEVQVTVNYTNSTSVDYGIMFCIMIGKEKYFLGVDENGQDIVNYTKMRENELLAEKAKAEELATKGKTLENEFYDKIGRKINHEDCQGIESVKLVNIEVLEKEHNYLKVIEKSDQFIKCVDEAKVKDVVQIYFLRGKAFEALYKTEISGKTYPIKFKKIPENLIKAIESFEEAFELIEYANWWNCRLYNPEKARLLAHTVLEAYIYAQELENQGKLTDAMPYYEAICIGGKRIESPTREMKQALAVAGYYAGATAINNQEDSKALEYLPFAFPIDEAYLHLSKEELSSKFLTDGETSANMYYNLGIILYNTAFDMFDLDITAKQTKKVQAIKTKLLDASICMKLVKILDPKITQADLMLKKIDMLLESVNKL